MIRRIFKGMHLQCVTCLRCFRKVKGTDAHPILEDVEDGPDDIQLEDFNQQGPQNVNTDDYNIACDNNLTPAGGEDLTVNPNADGRNQPLAEVNLEPENRAAHGGNLPVNPNADGMNQPLAEINLAPVILPIPVSPDACTVNPPV